MVLHQFEGSNQFLGLLFAHGFQVPLGSALVAIGLVPCGLPAASEAALAQTLLVAHLMDVDAGSAGQVACCAGKADVHHIVAVLRACIVEAHQGVCLGAKAVIVGKLFAQGHVDHLYATLLLVETPQEAAVLVILGAPVEFVVECAIESLGHRLGLDHRIAVDVHVARLGLHTVLQVGHQAVVAVGEAEEHFGCQHSGIVVLHLAHDGLHLVDGHGAGRSGLQHIHGLLQAFEEELLGLIVVVLSEALAHVEMGVFGVGEIGVIVEQQLLDGLLVGIRAVHAINLQLCHVEAGASIRMRLCVVVIELHTHILGSLGKIEGKRHHVLAHSMVRHVVKLALGVGHAVGTGLHDEIGVLAGCAAGAAACHQSHIALGGLGQLHCDVVGLGHLAVPVGVPEGVDVAIDQVLDVQALLLITGVAAQLPGIGNQFRARKEVVVERNVETSFFLCREREATQHEHDKKVKLLHDLLDCWINKKVIDE